MYDLHSLDHMIGLDLIATSINIWIMNGVNVHGVLDDGKLDEKCTDEAMIIVTSRAWAWVENISASKLFADCSLSVIISGIGHGFAPKPPKHEP